MPEKSTRQRAKRARKSGKSASTQAGEYVREEIRHVRQGKHGAKSTKQAIAIGLAKARRAGVSVKAPPKEKASEDVRKKAESDLRAGRKKTAAKKSAKRSAASARTLKKSGRSAASKRALSRQARNATSKRMASKRSTSAKKAVRTKEATLRSRAAKKRRAPERRRGRNGIEATSRCDDDLPRKGGTPITHSATRSGSRRCQTVMSLARKAAIIACQRSLRSAMGIASVCSICLAVVSMS